MILYLPLPRGPGRTVKPVEPRVQMVTLDRQSQLREQHDEILLLTVLLRTIASTRGEHLGPGRIDTSAHIAMAKRIDRRVDMLLSVDWELQRAKEMIGEYLPN